MHFQTIKNYIFPLILLGSLVAGGFTGHYLEKDALYLKPFGEIFLNLILTTIVPLIFFSICSATIRAGVAGKLGTIFFWMGTVFLVTGIIAALCSLMVVLIFPPAESVHLQLSVTENMNHSNMFNHISGIFTVTRFSELLSHEHMLALILFSILIGISVVSIKEKGRVFSDFIQSGEAVFMRVFSLIMYCAPAGFFAYFAVLVSELGPELMESYARIFIIYTIFSLVYFVLIYTLYAFMADKYTGVQLFWKNIWIPALTAVATCSSAASIPANIAATKSMGVLPEVSETVIPLGSLVHKDGSVIGGMFKIAFLFGLFHLDFSGAYVLITALGIALLVGTVMGAIPGGGMLGELLILSIYGFPASVLIAIAAISIIIDPMATMLNVTGNSASCLLINRKYSRQ